MKKQIKLEILALCPFCGIHYQDSLNLPLSFKYGDKFHGNCPFCGVSGSQIFIHRLSNIDLGLY